MLVFIAIAQKTVSCKNLIWILLFLSRKAKPTHVNPKCPSYSEHCSHINTGTESLHWKPAWDLKAPQTCNLCLYLIYRKRLIWLTLKAIFVYIWKRSLPPEQFLAIAKAFIIDPQEPNFHPLRIFMLPKTNPCLHLLSKQGFSYQSNFLTGI